MCKPETHVFICKYHVMNDINNIPFNSQYIIPHFPLFVYVIS